MRCAWVVFAVVLAWTAPRAAAQPWAQNVTDAQKADAQKKLEAGNQLFLSKKYKEALEQYAAATKVWDHPAIRFNMVRCLILLERPIEAFDNLQLALKYGKEPLEENVYNEALGYQKLLANQIGDLEVSCTEQGAEVILDGKKLMTCPNKQTRRLQPGQHGIVATKQGFLTKQLTVFVTGGKTEVAKLELVPLENAAKIVHRWPGWVPWVVFGGGIVVAGIGGFAKYTASEIMADYDRTIARDCAGGGCDLSNPDDMRARDLNAQYDTAITRDRIAITVISVGAAGIIAGGVMLFLNRGQTVYDNSAETRGPTGATRLDVVPTDGGGVMTVRGWF